MEFEEIWSLAVKRPSWLPSGRWDHIFAIPGTKSYAHYPYQFSDSDYDELSLLCSKHRYTLVWRPKEESEYHPASYKILILEPGHDDEKIELGCGLLAKFFRVHRARGEAGTLDISHAGEALSAIEDAFRANNRGRPEAAGGGLQRKRRVLRLHSVSFKNFKSFRDEVTIPLGQITCLIGPNGAGKSNILHGLKMLSDIIIKNDYIPEPGDYFDNDATQEMKMTAVLELSEDDRHAIIGRIKPPPAVTLGSHTNWLFKRLKYEISFTSEFVTHTASLTFTDANYETIVSVRSSGGQYSARRRRIGLINMVEKSLPDLESYAARSTDAANLLKQIDESLSSHIIDFFSEIVHTTTQRMIPASTEIHESHGITSDGSDILNELNNLPRKEQLEFDKFLASITGKSILSVEPKVRGSKLVLEAAEQGLNRRTPPVDFGSGQAQLVLLALQLFAKRGTVFMLTEPELHLHAKAQKRLRRRLEVASDNMQILIETHSPIFLGTAEDENVLLVTKPEGLTHVGRIAPESMRLIREELGISHADALYNTRVLFVEGESELVAFQMFWRTLYPASWPAPTFFSLGGAGNTKHLPLILEYLKSDDRHFFAILDNHADARAHVKSKLCDRLLGTNCHFLPKSFEDEFSNKQIASAFGKMAADRGFNPFIHESALDAAKKAGKTADHLKKLWADATGSEFDKVELAGLLGRLPGNEIPAGIKVALDAAAAGLGSGGSV